MTDIDKLKKVIKDTVLALEGEPYIDYEPTSLREAIEIVREIANDVLDELA
jgi:hypothetical protein